MSKRVFFIISGALLVLMLAACGTPQTVAPTAAPHSTTSSTTSPTSAAMPSPAANLPNPASENCVKQGGTVSIQKNSDGSEYGLCVFPDGKQCEEWAMQRGECPVGGIAVVGRYTGQLPAADAIGRVIVLELLRMVKRPGRHRSLARPHRLSIAAHGLSRVRDIVVAIDTPTSDKQTLTFAYDNGALILQDAAKYGYGADGLTLARTPSGNTYATEFGGVKIAFDAQLATVGARRECDGRSSERRPGNGWRVSGGDSLLVRWCDCARLSRSAPGAGAGLQDRRVGADSIRLLLKDIADLKNLLATKPAVITGSIPVLPVIPAAQVFHVKPQYLDFKNGSGVGFVTYYSQAVNPITAKDLFYTFQGNDE